MNNTIKRTWMNDGLVNIDNLTGMTFQDEIGGHTFEISGANATGAVTLSGTVSAVFIRPDSADVTIDGTISNGKAVVTLTEDCYLVPGRFFLTIFLTSSGQKTAIYAAMGTVSRTSGGAVTGDIPASVAELIAMIEQYSTLLESVANGHGGVKSIEKTGSTGTNPVVDTYTLTYADDTTFQFTVTNGVQGPPGPAATVTANTVTYQAGTSPSTPPSGTWLSSPPTVSPGDYLWTKIYFKFSDNTEVTSYSVARMGLNGSGAILTVCGISPDGSGNVALAASDVSAVPVSGSNGFLYRSSNAVGEKELNKVLYSDTTGWDSGDLTVTGISNYSFFIISIANASGTLYSIPVFGSFTSNQSDFTPTHFRAFGMSVASGTIVHLTLAALVTGDKLTMSACNYIAGTTVSPNQKVMRIVGVV